MEASSTTRNIMERVCTLDVIEKGSELYLMITHIFQKQEKREMFVVMEEPYLQLQFLQEEARFVTRALFWHLGCFMFYPLNNVLWKREMFLIFYCFIL